MMRTIEAGIVILIILIAFVALSYLIVLPSPREVSPHNLRALALTILKNLDSNGFLSEVAFSESADSWNELQIALSASLPPNIAYNLTVYEIVGGYYIPKKSISNVIGKVSFTESISYIVSSPAVTYRTVAQKISENGKNLTLYILNCEDANGWWITGYTAQTLALDLYNLLSPYFETTILVNSTSQLLSLLDGNKITSIPTEEVMDAVIINTFGEAVPIPSEYCQGGSREDEGYDPEHGEDPEHGKGSYALYCYNLGKNVSRYNWKWVSIVGYPFYYVTNTIALSNSQNNYGIYGVERVGPAGLNAFLRGLNNDTYDAWWLDGNGKWKYGDDWIARDITKEYQVLVHFTPEAYFRSNYYGIYPSPYQSASRALPGPGAEENDITSQYNLSVEAEVFEPVDGYYAAATFRHNSGKGALVAIGLTRTPDIRVAALALLIYYRPEIYKKTFTAPGKSRLVVLQLAELGGM